MLIRQIAALFAALLVGLVVFLWVESDSSSFQNCVNQERTKTTSNQSGEQKNPAAVVVRSYARCTERFADQHNAFTTALATILLAVITLGLILGGIDQQRTTRAQSRAYMSVVGGQYRQGGTRGLKFEFRPVVLNTGESPAYDVQVSSTIRFLTTEQAATFDFRLPKPVGASVVTLGPRQDRFVHRVLIGDCRRPNCESTNKMPVVCMYMAPSFTATHFAKVGTQISATP